MEKHQQQQVNTLRQLALAFQTFNDFIRVRKSKGLEYRWVDMFVGPTTVARGGPTANTPHTLKYDSEYYRIRVDVGYHTDDGIGEVLATQNRSFPSARRQ